MHVSSKYTTHYIPELASILYPVAIAVTDITTSSLWELKNGRLCYAKRRISYTVDREIFVVKNFRRRSFPTKIKYREIFCAR